MAEALYGQAKVGRASADLSKKFGVKEGAKTIVMLPYGDKASTKKTSKFAVDESGQSDAKKAVLDSLPSSQVMQLNSQVIDQWMSLQMTQTSESQSICLLFSDKPVVPALFRSVSLSFEGRIGFGMVHSADTALMQRFGIDKAPALMVLFPDASKAAADGQMQLGGMRYEPRQHGPFKYGYVANFISQIVSGRLSQLGKAPTDGDGPAAAKPAAGKKDVGPLPELTTTNFDEACAKAGGLCAIAMLDGSPQNANKQSNLDMLTKMRKKRAGGPLSFSWLDATCQTAFAAAFNIYETDLPTMVVLSPSKLKWARAVGAFDADSLGAFGTGVATGRIRTDPISEIPKLEGVDCATFVRGGEILEEETPLGDDIMAEILEEERREREAREAELAAAGVAVDEAASASKGKDKSQMSKLERLEAEVEQCEAMDLLCSARREKQLKAVQKQRDLEDKLKEIAAKKKKKAKKAKTKAAAA